VIVVAAAALAKEMMRHTTKVPIVMAAGNDLVARGVVLSFARPGGNVTGFSIQVGPEIDAKRMQILKETAPTTGRVAYLGTTAEWNTNGAALQSAAQALNISTLFVEHGFASHADAFHVLENEGPDALIVSSFTSRWVKRQAIFDFALQRRTPVIYPWREYIDMGGLMSYGVNLVDQWRRSADYVDKILKGANPGELPIQLPTNFDLVINLKAAKAIGLKIPAPVLAQAAEVIE
jgi:putative ABC transport system substrate-binding protein